MMILVKAVITLALTVAVATAPPMKIATRAARSLPATTKDAASRKPTTSAIATSSKSTAVRMKVTTRMTGIAMIAGESDATKMAVAIVIEMTAMPKKVATRPKVTMKWVKT